MFYKQFQLNRLINEGNSKEIEKVEAMPMASAATPEHNQQQLVCFLHTFSWC